MNWQLFILGVWILKKTRLLHEQHVVFAKQLSLSGVLVLSLIACSGSTDSYGRLPRGTLHGTIQISAPTRNTDGTTLSDLSGYIVYFGSSPDALNQKVVLDNPDLIANDVSELIDQTSIIRDRTYYVMVKAVNSRNIRSSYSNIVRLVAR